MAAQAAGRTVASGMVAKVQWRAPPDAELSLGGAPSVPFSHDALLERGAAPQRMPYWPKDVVELRDQLAVLRAAGWVGRR
jgi:hypothetical protein